MSVGLWGCSIFRNSENRENPVFIGICMWILMVAFGRDSAARRPLAAGRWLGATPHLPWFRWGARCGIAAPGLRAGRVGGWHLQTWPTWPRVWLEILRGQRPRPFYGPGSSTGPPERERASALGDAATRREWCRGLAPYAAVAFPGPRQVPIGSSMPVI